MAKGARARESTASSVKLAYTIRGRGATGYTGFHGVWLNQINDLGFRWALLWHRRAEGRHRPVWDQMNKVATTLPEELSGGSQVPDREAVQAPLSSPARLFTGPDAASSSSNTFAAGLWRATLVRSRSDLSPSRSSVATPTPVSEKIPSSASVPVRSGNGSPSITLLPMGPALPWSSSCRSAPTCRSFGLPSPAKTPVPW